MGGPAYHARTHQANGSDGIAILLNIKVFGDATTVSTGDGAFIFAITPDLGGTKLKSAHAYVSTVSSSGALTVQVRNVTDAVDMLSTAITIDASETTSYTALTAPAVNATNAQVSRSDLIAIDVDGAGTGAKGLGVMLVFGQ